MPVKSKFEAAQRALGDSIEEERKIAIETARLEQEGRSIMKTYCS